jgi:hypothetical protein
MERAPDSSDLQSGVGLSSISPLGRRSNDKSFPVTGMIKETISKIEERLQSSAAISVQERADLLKLLATLKAEVAELSTTDAERAQSIAGFTAVSTHEAIREEKNPVLQELSLKGLASSVEGFEQSHPRLVQVVNSICTTLSNLGI